MSEPTPEAFLKGIPETEGENPQTAEERTFIDNMPKLREIKDEILRTLDGRWTKDDKEGRFASGFLKEGTFAVTQDYGVKKEGLATLEVTYNHYEGDKRTTITLLFIHFPPCTIDRYGFEAERRVKQEGRGELDLIKSTIWTNYKDNKAIDGNSVNPREGLEFAQEVRDALVGKPLGQPGKFTRRNLLSLGRAT